MRRQCAKCPWKVSTDPYDIPGGYCAEKHAKLDRTIAEPAQITVGGTMCMMACHETPPGREKFCVGWFDHQMGPGNNIGLRLAVATGDVDYHVETVGEQHVRFEDTLPE